MTGAPAVLVVLCVVGVVLLWPRRPAPWAPVLRSRGNPLGAGAPSEPVRPARSAWGAWWRRRSRRRRREDDAALVGLLDVLVPALRAGLPVLVAVQHLAPGVVEGSRAGGRGREPTEVSPLVTGLVADLVADATSGRPLADAWARHARRSGSAEAAFVARAWALSEALGAPLAECASVASRSVRDRTERRHRLEAAVAGPRATAAVLTALPAAGPLVALLFGIPVTDLYAGWSALSGLVGVVLLLGGRAWCARLLVGVTRPRPVGAR